MSTLKGSLHIHSTYSDGEFKLIELREIFLSSGFRFACVTDHAEWFDAAKVDAYVKECAALSDERFQFVPGLEFECEQKMHILGYGMTTRLATRDPVQAIRGIRAAGGIAVIAHPKDEAFAWIESFDELPDGIEAWNTKYDGRFAPRPETFRLIQRLQERRPDLLAFYGQDLHWKKQYRGMFIELHGESTERQHVLQALRSGDYSARNGGIELTSSGAVSEETLAKFSAVQQRYARVRQWLKLMKKATDHVGIPVPGRVKAQLRRIF
jgi:predicted metal-dependent phosphoesterase TrpH